MAVAAFEPKFMQIGVLTAALQELTPREKRDKDPDLAIEEWLAFARELATDYVQLSAALHPTKADVPAEAMLDPLRQRGVGASAWDGMLIARMLAADSATLRAAVVDALAVLRGGRALPRVWLC